MSIEPEDYELDTVVVSYQHFTVDSDGTAAAAGTVTFELISPTRIKTAEGIDVTLKPIVGYLGEDGAMRRESRFGEEGVPLVCVAHDFPVDELIYRAKFDLTDGLGSGRIRQKDITFAVRDDDIDLTKLT